MYRLMQDPNAVERADGAIIPTDLGNRDYAAYLAWVADGNTPEPAPVVPAAIAPISDRQFAQGLAHREIITKTEAIAWAARGELPAALSGFLTSLSEAGRFDAEIILSSATEFRRDHPLVAVIGVAQGMTPADIDEFWRYCATL